MRLQNQIQGQPYCLVENLTQSPSLLRLQLITALTKEQLASYTIHTIITFNHHHITSTLILSNKF